MEKLDLRKQHKHLYAPSAKQVEVVDVPELKFVTIDGQIEAGEGGPSTSAGFQEALQAVYGASFTLKFMSKQRQDNPIDFGVMALEGLWWVEGEEFDITKPGAWSYRLLMMQPDHIDDAMFQEALAQLQRKRPSATLARLRLASFHEGLSVQIMHVGPYAAEPETVARLHAYAADHGYRFRGAHHEIYLGDPRRSAPDKLRTILRQPVQRSDV